MTDKFKDDLMKAIMGDDEVPEGYERCEDCGGLHPIGDFPRYEGPVIYRDTDPEYSQERTNRIAEEAADALDGAMMDKLQSLLAMVGMSTRTPIGEMASLVLASGAAFNLVEAVSKFRRDNPNHTHEELIALVRLVATDNHVKAQSVNQTLARLIISNPPPPAPEGAE